MVHSWVNRTREMNCQSSRLDSHNSRQDFTKMIMTQHFSCIKISNSPVRTSERLLI